MNCPAEVKPPEIHVRLPGWIRDFLEQSAGVFPSVTDRMEFVIELSRQNVKNKTGGPFAAAVFDKSGLLVAPGVNLVVTANCSVLHAEITALILAQKRLGRYDISDGGWMDYDLFASTEPCAMCFGAILWSGVRRLVCGAGTVDAEAIGFYEGPKPDDWVAALEARGIRVIRGVLRKEAFHVLKDYRSSGGIIYNPGCRKH